MHLPDQLIQETLLGRHWLMERRIRALGGGMDAPAKTDGRSWNVPLFPQWVDLAQFF